MNTTKRKQMILSHWDRLPELALRLTYEFDDTCKRDFDYVMEDLENKYQKGEVELMVIIQRRAQ